MYVEIHADGKPLTYKGKPMAFDAPAVRAMMEYGGFERAERQGAVIEQHTLGGTFVRTHHVMEGWPSIVGPQRGGR